MSPTLQPSGRRWIIDAPSTDAEDILDISGDGMAEDEFDASLIGAGCVAVRDLNAVDNVYTGVTRHLSGGWYLWQYQG